MADGSEDGSLHSVALPQRLSLHRLSRKPARARRELTHDDGGHEIGRERNPVCGVPQSERVNGWEEEKVERQQGGDANGDRVRQPSEHSDRDDGDDIEDAEAQDGCGRAECVDRSGDSGNGSDAQADALRELDSTAPCHEDLCCGHTTALSRSFLQHVRPVLVREAVEHARFLEPAARLLRVGDGIELEEDEDVIRIVDLTEDPLARGLPRASGRSWSNIGLQVS